MKTFLFAGSVSNTASLIDAVASVAKCSKAQAY